MERIAGLSGPGNDDRHQIIIAYLVHGLMEKFIKVKKYNNFIPLPEFSLQPDSAQVPDITIWKTIKNVPLVPVVLIEICWPNKVTDEVKKLSNLMTIKSSIKESFIIDKESLSIKRIHRLKSNKPSAVNKSSTIDAFKIDLSSLLTKVSIR